MVLASSLARAVRGVTAHRHCVGQQAIAASPEQDGTSGKSFIDNRSPPRTLWPWYLVERLPSLGRSDLRGLSTLIRTTPGRMPPDSDGA